MNRNYLSSTTWYGKSSRQTLEWDTLDCFSKEQVYTNKFVVMY